MLECLIVGDSIAVGTKMFKPECAVMAKGGWNSAQWNRRYGLEELRAHTVIISLGSNDYAGIQTEAELRAIRARARADRVYWILPHGNLNSPQNLPISEIQRIVTELAEYYGDIVLPINRIQPDGIHPSWEGYKDIAARAK